MLTEHIDLPPCSSGTLYVQANEDGTWGLAFWKVGSSGEGFSVKVGDVSADDRWKAYDEMCTRIAVIKALES